MGGAMTAAALHLPPDRGRTSLVSAKFGIRRHQVEFRLAGAAGDRLTVAHTPSEQLGDGALYKFRGDRFLAVDSLGGRGTFVRSVTIGAVRLPPVDMRAPTSEFHDRYLGGGVRYPLCQPRSLISIEVEFAESCEWRAVMYGDAVVVPSDQEETE